jgi:ATP-binding cassette subfamily C (CFTR/MRP) protein 1
MYVHESTGIDTTAFYPDRILVRSSPQVAIAWDTTHVFYVVSASCAAIFLLFLPARLRELRISGIKATSASGQQALLKAVSNLRFPFELRNPNSIEIKAFAILLSIILLAYLAELLTSSGEHEALFVLSLVASLVAALGLSPLLFLEQKRSLKPSDLATLYLVASILCDVVLLANPVGITDHTKTSRPVLARCLMHLTLLIFECHSKRSTSSVLGESQSPEELSGVLSRAFFTWINPILFQGYKNLLVDQDLPPLSQDLKPKVIRKAILQAWDQRG